MSDERLKLVSFNLCPFVQRAAIVLEEQGRPYEIEYIDLANKPAWFLELSPLGKVPLLQVDDTVLFESGVIAAYLDETFEGDQLLDADPLARAEQRMWMEFISELTGKAWTLQAAKDAAAAEEAAEVVRTRLDRLDGLIAERGPLWGGERFTMVDAAAAPVLQRLTWAERLEPSLRLFEGRPALAAWRDVLLERPSVKASVLPDLESINRDLLAGYDTWIARHHGAA